MITPHIRNIKLLPESLFLIHVHSPKVKASAFNTFFGLISYQNGMLMTPNLVYILILPNRTSVRLSEAPIN